MDGHAAHAEGDRGGERTQPAAPRGVQRELTTLPYVRGREAGDERRESVVGNGENRQIAGRDHVIDRQDRDIGEQRFGASKGRGADGAGPDDEMTGIGQGGTEDRADLPGTDNADAKAARRQQRRRRRHRASLSSWKPASRERWTAMSEATPNPILTSDALVLIAVLGRFEGELRGGAMSGPAIETLGARCRSVGLLDPHEPARLDSVAAILEDIGQRLRYAIGEYDADPTRP